MHNPKLIKGGKLCVEKINLTCVNSYEVTEGSLCEPSRHDLCHVTDKRDRRKYP